jgi:hypothetical protein
MNEARRKEITKAISLIEEAKSIIETFACEDCRNAKDKE